jgi:hypothetical protein
MDLVVWLCDDNSIAGFQLPYDQTRSEHALTWKYRSGFRHDSVDDGEGRPGKYKATPILTPDGIFPAPVIAERFKQRATGIDEAISNFVHTKLLEFPDSLSKA